MLITDQVAITPCTDCVQAHRTPEAKPRRLRFLGPSRLGWNFLTRMIFYKIILLDSGKVQA